MTLEDAWYDTLRSPQPSGRPPGKSTRVVYIHGSPGGSHRRKGRYKRTGVKGGGGGGWQYRRSLMPIFH